MTQEVDYFKNIINNGCEPQDMVTYKTDSEDLYKSRNTGNNSDKTCQIKLNS